MSRMRSAVAARTLLAAWAQTPASVEPVVVTTGESVVGAAPDWAQVA